MENKTSSLPSSSSNNNNSGSIDMKSMKQRASQAMHKVSAATQSAVAQGR